MLIWRLYAAVPVMCFYVRANKCGSEEYELMSCRGGWWNHVNISDWQLFVKGTCVKERVLSPPAVSLDLVFTRKKKRNIKPVTGLQDRWAPFWANKCCGSNPTALLSHSSIRGQFIPLRRLLRIYYSYTSLWRNLLCYSLGVIVKRRKWCRTCSWWRDFVRNIRPTKRC